MEKMKQYGKTLFFLTALTLFLYVWVLPCAAYNEQHVWDGAGLLTDTEVSTLNVQLEDICTRQNMEVVVVTVQSLNGVSAMTYADDFYDNNGCGMGTARDGLLLLLAMDERDWWISTCGAAISVFTDVGIGYLSDQFVPYLSAGDYMGGFTCFAEQCDAYMTQAVNADPYDYHNLPAGDYKEDVYFYDDGSSGGRGFGLQSVFKAVLIGFLISLIVVSCMKRSLKSISRQRTASHYKKEGSFQLTASHEMFLYRNVSRTRKPDDDHHHGGGGGGGGGGSSVHRSSSGSSHGGGGGKF